jgi:hypothetical protein
MPVVGIAALLRLAQTFRARYSNYRVRIDTNGPSEANIFGKLNFAFPLDKAGIAAGHQGRRNRYALTRSVHCRRKNFSS